MKATLLAFTLLFVVSASFGKQRYKLPKDYQFVPSGTTEIDDKKVSIQAFHILNHEITNLEYREFLYDLKTNGKDSLYKKVLPDTAAWQELIPNSYNEPMVKLYFSHPAYNNYPVVNVSQEAANYFCSWLTEKLRIKYGELINDARLPTKHEWIYAAQGGNTKNIYPWGGPKLRNDKGEYLANFKVIGDQNIQKTEDGYTVVTSENNLRQGDDYALFTASCYSYAPNAYGLHNMSGNVAELTSDGKARGGSWNSTGYDVRILSEEDFTQSNPFTGFRPVITYHIPSE